MESSSGSLTVLDAHTPNAKVFWNGVLIQGVQSIRVFDSLKDDNSGEVRLRVVKDANGVDLINALCLAGITVKEVAK